MSRLFVFDLDGVLIDSILNMSQAWDAVRVKLEIDVPFEDYKEQIGKPFPDIMKDIGLFDRHLEIFEVYRSYSRMNIHTIPMYEGVNDTLNELKDRGNKIALCTSKTKETTEILLSKFPKFDFVSCPQNGLRGKPAPDQLLYTMAMCNADPRDTIYVGDMVSDYQAAQRAGIHFEFATWGYGDFECEHKLKNITNLI